MFMLQPEPAVSKFPRRERALGGNPQARTPTNNATSRLGGRAPKRRSPWGMLVQESFHPQLISTDMSDKHKLLFQTINNIQKNETGNDYNSVNEQTFTITDA
jgi:hypothetical protein